MVYLAGYGDYLKIGWSRDVPRRIRDLQTGATDTIILYASFPGDRELERHLQVRFKAHRAKGEWFRKAPEIAAFIEQKRASS